MNELLSNVDAGLPLVLVLLALLGLRMRLSPRAWLFIAAPPQRVFDLLDLRDGDRQRWHRTDVSVALTDPASKTYTIRYASTGSAGTPRVFHAAFRVAEHQPPRRLVLERAGLEGKSLNNELLSIVGDLTPEGDGTRLTLTYHWGPRPLIAQLLARTDLWGSIYRLKSVAETGTASTRADSWISAGVALVTGLVTLGAFCLLFGWTVAVLIAAALFVHEFGHLLAFRMAGQPWGRLGLLPFLGALAVPRQAYETQGESVFSALMGPGFSLVLPALAVIALWTGAASALWLTQLGMVAAALNLFNLLPVEPLDGGVALRSVFQRLLGASARFALIAAGALLCLAGWIIKEPLLMVFGGLSIAVNFRPRAIDVGLTPLGGLGVALSVAFYVLIAALHITAIGVLRGA